MVKQYRSDHLRIVIQAYQELGIKVAHRSEIIRKWREIRRREGLDTIHDNWVDYVFHTYPEFFKNVRKGSGMWEYLE
jgi:hypothetical protein